MSHEKTSQLLPAFGRRIVQLRTARGWTAVELGQHAEIEIEKLEQIERGSESASLDEMRRLAGALEITLSVLMDFREADHSS